MILQGTQGGPHTRRARLALEAASMDYQFQPCDGDEPTLNIAKGEPPLEGSVDIVDWVLDQPGAPQWWNETDVDQLDDGLYLIELCDGPFSDYVAAFLESDDREQRLEAEACAAGFVDQLTQLLEQATDHTAPALLGSEVGLADFAIWPFIERFQAVAEHLPEKALVWQRWCEIMRAHPHWQAVLVAEQP